MIHLTILFHHRDLLWLWTGREVRVRYKQSMLGAAWAIIQPLAFDPVRQGATQSHHPVIHRGPQGAVVDFRIRHPHRVDLA